MMHLFLGVQLYVYEYKLAQMNGFFFCLANIEHCRFTEANIIYFIVVQVTEEQMLAIIAIVYCIYRIHVKTFCKECNI
jgi:hypothetical protein